MLFADTLNALPANAAVAPILVVTEESSNTEFLLPPSEAPFSTDNIAAVFALLFRVTFTWGPDETRNNAPSPFAPPIAPIVMLLACPLNVPFP